jgi:hypothetical protein
MKVFVESLVQVGPRQVGRGRGPLSPDSAFAAPKSRSGLVPDKRAQEVAELAEPSVLCDFYRHVAGAVLARI